MEKGYYSQGRIYLFVSIVAYYTALGILTCTGLSHKKANIDINNFKIIIIFGYICTYKSLKTDRSIQ